ncbi:MAG: multidrug ABC transporter ATP-binding protein [Herpetosiphonaceae bacterium]|nr:MAG: multidrug ABC transporter ATP-binding protein [Herpetosiphonaceae bacterium]
MPAISARGLTRAFGERVAVDNLTFDIAHGEVFGFLGPNGAGKTTTVRMLTGLIAPTSGACTVAGYELGFDNQRIRRAVGVLTETPGLYDKLSAEQNLLFYAAIYELDSRTAREQVQHYLRMMDLWDRREHLVGTFSKGMRQKLAIARALLHNPQIVFLDEPTAGLDPEAANVVRDVIRSLRGEGRTIFLTSHNLHEVDQLCDRVAIFRERLLRLDTPANLRAGLFDTQHLIEFAGAAEPWLATVRALPFVREASVEDRVLVISLQEPASQKPALIRALVEAGAEVQNVQDRQYSLEEVYLQLIRDGATAGLKKEMS